MLSCLLYFSAGLVLDLLITLHYIAVCGGRAVQASILSGIVTVLNLWILDKYINSHNPMLLLGYIGGTMAGTWIAISVQRSLKKEMDNARKL